MEVIAKAPFAVVSTRSLKKMQPFQCSVCKTAINGKLQPAMTTSFGPLLASKPNDGRFARNVSATYDGDKWP